MSLTTNQGLIIPDSSDVNNVPTSVNELITGGGTPASGLENRLVQRYLSSTDRATRNPTPFEGELSYLIDQNGYETFTGSSWITLIPQVRSFNEGTTFSGVVSLTYITAGAPLCGVAITVPPSGQVRIDWTTIMDNTVAANICFMSPSLNDGNVVGAGAVLSAPADGNSSRSQGTNLLTTTGFVVVGGLSVGTDVNAFLAHRVDGGSGSFGVRKIILSHA